MTSQCYPCIWNATYSTAGKPIKQRSYNLTDKSLQGRSVPQDTFLRHYQKGLLRQNHLQVEVAKLIILIPQNSMDCRVETVMDERNGQEQIPAIRLRGSCVEISQRSSRLREIDRTTKRIGVHLSVEITDKILGMHDLKGWKRMCILLKWKPGARIGTPLLANDLARLSWQHNGSQKRSSFSRKALIIWSSPFSSFICVFHSSIWPLTELGIELL